MFYGHTGLTYAVELIAGIGPTACNVLTFFLPFLFHI